ncbi:MAG: selenium metabolism-associated LysR family transcriptional regulator [Suipraeoptans sp.]
MNLKQIEAFVQVAEVGSYSKAAKKMYLTQPTVSAHIFSLEKELNARLFIRNTKEVYLTEEGRNLYKYAKEMIDLERKIEEIFSGNEAESANGITIAASTIPSQYLLPEIIIHYRDKYPNEQLKIVETDSLNVITRIIDHAVDVGFTGTVLDKKHCKYIPFYRDNLVIITPNNEHFRELDEDIMSDLHWICDEPIIVREEGSGTRKEAEKQLKVSGIDMSELNIVATIENQETIKKSVSQGMGISILSELAVKDEKERGKLLTFKIPKADQGRNINLVYNKNYPLSRSVQRFIRIVEEMKYT